MSKSTFRRFGNPGYLRNIKPENLLKLLRRSSDFFKSKGFDPGGANLTDGQLDQLSAIIVSPPGDCPGEFLAAVDLLEMLTSGAGIDELRMVAPDLVRKVHEFGDSVGDVVMKVWLLDPKVIQRIYTKFSLKMDRTMTCFRPDGGRRPVEPSRDSCKAIARDLEYCCGDLFDLPICEVMAFPESAGHAFLIRHGERVRRLEVFDDNRRRDVKALRPVKHDVGFLDMATGELLFSGRSDEVKNTYRQVFSKHMFGDPAALRPSRRFTLEPLRIGRESLMCPDLPEISTSRLRKLTIRRKGTCSVTTHHCADVFNELALRGPDYLRDFDLVRACFAIHLAWERRILALMISPEDDKIQGDIHHPVARLWMDACKFNKSHEHEGILALS